MGGQAFGRYLYSLLMLPHVRFRTALAMRWATVPCHATMLMASGIGMEIGSG